MKVRKQITMVAVAILASLTITGCSSDNDESMLEFEQSKKVLSNEVCLLRIF